MRWHFARFGVGLLIISLVSVSFVQAATSDDWLATTTTPQSWNVGSNWSSGNVPSSSEAAVFGSGSLPSGTTSITVDASQSPYAVLYNPGSGGRAANIDTGTAGVLTVLSADSTADNVNTFFAFSVLFGRCTFNVPIQLGNGSSGAFTATLFSAVNTNNCVFNSTISESAGQTWGVRIDGNGTVIFAGGAKTYSGDTAIADNGILRVDNSILPNGAGKGNLVIEGSGQFIENNLDETINGLSSTSNSAMITKIGSNTRTLTIGAGNASASYAGAISESGGTLAITKTGAGVQAFTDNVNYNGLTIVAGGTLLVNGSHTSASTTNGYSISTGATLGGTGAINLNGGSVNVSSGAMIAPGASPGSLDVGARINFLTGSTYEAQLAGSTPGDTATNYDQLNMTASGQSVNLTGTVNLNLSLLGAFSPSPSDIFYILTRADTGAFTALFAGTSEGGIVNLGNGYTGLITYQADWTGTQGGSSLSGGNDVAIYAINVPEPMSLALIPLVAVAARRRSFLTALS